MVPMPKAAEPLNIYELHWAAGFLEGEGSFNASNTSGRARTRYIKIVCPQVQLEPLERLQKVMRCGAISLRRTEGRGEIHEWSCCGTNAAAWMMTLWSLMSPKRRGQIEKCLSIWRERPLAKNIAPERTGFCFRGHPWIPENIVISSRGSRTCKMCRYDQYLKLRRATAARAAGKTCNGPVQLVLDNWQEKRGHWRRRTNAKSHRRRRD